MSEAQLLNASGQVILKPVDVRHKMILPYMLSLVITSLKAAGTNTREDVTNLIGKVSAAALTSLPQKQVQSTAKRVERDGYSVLSKTGIGDLETLFGAMGRVIVFLGEEGFDVDKDSHLVGLLICNDILEDPKQFGGKVNIDTAQNRLINELQDAGYFNNKLLQL